MTNAPITTNNNIIQLPARDFIREKGIDAAAHAIGGARVGNRWKFPAYHQETGILLNWTFSYNVTEAARAEYGKINIANKPPQLHFYRFPDLVNSIALADGVLWMASGKTDYLTFRMCNHNNAIWPFGGERVMAKLNPEWLKTLGVRTVRNFPDADDVGNDAAIKLQAALDGSGINLELLKLPTPIKDVNELFVTVCEQKTNAMQIWLTGRSAEKYEVQPDPQNSAQAENAADGTKPVTRPGGAREPHRINLERQQAIIAHLEPYEAGKPVVLPTVGKTIPLHCIHPNNHKNGDKNPSAWLKNVAGMLSWNCSGCGAAYSQIDLLTHFGIATSESKFLAGQIPPGIGGPDAISFVDVGTLSTPILLAALPPRLRSRLSLIDHANLARFIELSWRKGIVPGEDYTIAAWHSKVGDVFSLRTTQRLCVKIEPILFCTLAVKRIVSKMTQSPYGRKVPLHTAPTVAQIADFVKLKNAAHDRPSPLPLEAFSSVLAYRQYSHLAYIAAHSDWWAEKDRHPATQQFADQLGMSKETVWRYERDDLIPKGLLHREDRTERIKLADGELLTDEEKKSRWELETAKDGTRYKVRYRTSKRKTTAAYDDKFINQLWWCEQCGQSVTADMQPETCACGSRVYSRTEPTKQSVAMYDKG